MINRRRNRARLLSIARFLTDEQWLKTWTQIRQHLVATSRKRPGIAQQLSQLHNRFDRLLDALQHEREVVTDGDDLRMAQALFERMGNGGEAQLIASLSQVFKNKPELRDEVVAKLEALLIAMRGAPPKATVSENGGNHVCDCAAEAA